MTAPLVGEVSYRQLVEGIADVAIFMLTPDGTVASWNLAAERIKGYSAAEIVGQPFSRFYTETDTVRGAPARALAIAKTTGRFAGEGWRVRKDGGRFWASVVIDALHKDGELIGFAKITTDSTDRSIKEEHRRVIVDAAPNGMLVIDAAGTIALANTAAERLFGHSAGALVGLAVQRLLSGDAVDRFPFRNALQGVDDGSTPSALGAIEDVTGWRSDGSVFTAEVSLSATETAQGAVIVASITDVTQRRAGEARLRESEASLADANRLMTMAEEMAQYGHWRIDLLSGDVYWSPEVCRIHGVPIDYTPTLDVGIAAYDPDGPDIAAIIRQASIDGKPFTFESRILHQDNTFRDVRCSGRGDFADGRLVAVIGIFQDVTEQKEAERERDAVAERDRATTTSLQEKIRMLVMVEQMAHVGHWRLDVRSNEYVWSDEVYRAFDIPQTVELTLQTVMSACHPDDRERVMAARARAVVTLSPYKTESRIVRPDGSIRHVVSMAQPEFGSDGSVVAFTGAFQDVTEAKDLELERIRLLERVQTAAQTGNVGIWEWDPVTDGVVWDATMFSLFGLSDQADPKLWMRAVHPADQRYVTQAVAEALRERSLFDVEYRLLWPNGETHHLHCRGIVKENEAGEYRMLGTAWDVTEVREITSMMAEKIRMLALAEQLAHVGHWRLDVRSNKYVWSDEVYQTFGIPRTGQLTLEAVMNACHPDDREHVMAARSHASATKSPYRTESRIIRPDGGIRHVVSMGQPELASDGSVIAFAGAFQDITEAKAIQRQLIDEKAKFQRAVLPASLPHVSGCTFDAIYEPGFGDQLGGDWYDAVQLADGRILLSIGDVTGSGLDAAVVVGVVRQIIRGISQLHADPMLILDAADRALSLEYPDVYVSVWVGLIDLVTRTLTYGIRHRSWCPPVAFVSWKTPRPCLSECAEAITARPSPSVWPTTMRSYFIRTASPRPAATSLPGRKRSLPLLKRLPVPRRAARQPSKDRSSLMAQSTT